MANKFNEAYFDAVLTQAFTEFAKREIENEPSLEELKEKYPCPKKEIRRIKNRQKEKQYNRPIAILYLQRVAVCILAIVTLLSAVLITNTNVQAAVYETVVEWYDKYNIIFMNRIPEDEITGELLEGKTIFDLEIGYLPDGYELTMDMSDEVSRFYLYDNGNDQVINITIAPTDVLSVYVDNENSEMYESTINGYTAYITYSEKEHMGTIVWGDNNISVFVNGMLDEDILLKIAENIK